MRRALLPLAALAMVVLLVVGLMQAGDSESTGTDAPEPLSRSEVSRPIPGSPPVLADLRERVNVLAGDGTKAYDTQIRALRGHPVVVNLWASWCGPCRFELPFFQRQANARGGEVAFVGVNVGDNAADARRLSERYPMPYPSIEDPRRRVLDRLGARGLPATAFYDERGELQFLHQGLFPSEEKLAEAIARYAT